MPIPLFLWILGGSALLLGAVVVGEGAAGASQKGAPKYSSPPPGGYDLTDPAHVAAWAQAHAEAGPTAVPPPVKFDDRGHDMADPKVLAVTNSVPQLQAYAASAAAQGAPNAANELLAKASSIASQTLPGAAPLVQTAAQAATAAAQQAQQAAAMVAPPPAPTAIAGPPGLAPMIPIPPGIVPPTTSAQDFLSQIGAFMRNVNLPGVPPGTQDKDPAAKVPGLTAPAGSGISPLGIPGTAANSLGVDPTKFDPSLLFGKDGQVLGQGPVTMRDRTTNVATQLSKGSIPGLTPPAGSPSGGGSSGGGSSGGGSSGGGGSSASFPVPGIAGGGASPELLKNATDFFQKNNPLDQQKAIDAAKAAGGGFGTGGLNPAQIAAGQVGNLNPTDAASALARSWGAFRLPPPAGTPVSGTPAPASPAPPAFPPQGYIAPTGHAHHRLAPGDYGVDPIAKAWGKAGQGSQILALNPGAPWGTGGINPGDDVQVPDAWAISLLPAGQALTATPIPPARGGGKKGFGQDGFNPAGGSSGAASAPLGHAKPSAHNPLPLPLPLPAGAPVSSEDAQAMYGKMDAMAAQNAQHSVDLANLQKNLAGSFNPFSSASVPSGDNS